jgi:chloramphenicol 3-O-phosphotransferase
MPVRPPGTVILLNGTSSAGKSTMLRELPKVLEGSWKTVEGDDFVLLIIQKLIDHLNDKFGIETTYDELNDTCGKLMEEGKITQQWIDDFARQYDVNDLMFKKIHEHIRCGHNVVLDTVICEPIEEDSDEYDFNGYFNELGLYNVAFILVYCPFTTLVERVRMRNESGVAKERREYGVPIQFFRAMYKAAQPGDTPILDTLTRVEVRRLLETYVRSECETEKESNEFLSTVLKNLSLDRNESIRVTPRLKYDFIVNTGTHSSEECARQINEFLHSGRPFTAMRENARRLGLVEKRDDGAAAAAAPVVEGEEEELPLAADPVWPAVGKWQRFKDWVLGRG